MAREEAGRPRALAAAAFALAAALALVFARRRFVGFRNDDADYVLGALSILRGRLVELNSPFGRAFGYHWPGFSLLLAPFAALLAPRWQALKVVPLGLTAACAALALRRFERRLGAPWAALAAAAFALNPWTVQLASIVMAEPLLLLLALAAFERLDAVRSDDAREAARLSVLLGFAALARPEGVVLAAACAAALARAKRPRAAAGALAGPALAFAAWAWVKSAAGAPSQSYWSDWLGNLAALGPAPLLRHGLSVLTTLFAGVVFVLPAPRAAWGLAAGAALSAAALAACAAGAADLERRGKGSASGAAVALFAAGLLFLHLLWPVIDGRFFWPLLPFALEALLAGARAAAARRPSVRPAALAGACALVGWCAVRSATAAARPPAAADLLPARTYAWIRAHVPEDAAVFTNQPQALYLYTGRRAALTDAARADDAIDFRNRLRAQGFAYICYRDSPAQAGANLPSTERTLNAFALSLRWAASRPDAFTRVYLDPGEGSAIYAVAPRLEDRP